MPVSSFFALLDAVARKSVAMADDVAIASSPVIQTTATMTGKATGIVVDDVAVTSTGLGGLAQEREIPVVAKIAAGSFLINKLPLIGGLLAVNTVAPWVGTGLLLVGGAYLAYEGSHEVTHAVQQWRSRGKPHAEKPLDPSPEPPAKPTLLDRFGETAIGKRSMPAINRYLGTGREKQLITDLLTKDFILSAEIIVVSLGMATTAGLTGTGALFALTGVAAATTLGVYGTVMGLVRADNIAAHLAKAKGESQWAKMQRAIGNGVVKGMPYLMKGISAVGIFAMTAIGGEIVAEGLSLHLPGIHSMLGAFGYGLAGGSALMGVKMVGEKIWHAVVPPKNPPAPPSDASAAAKENADPKPADAAPGATVDPTTQPKPVGQHPKNEAVTGPFDLPVQSPANPNSNPRRNP